MENNILSDIRTNVERQIQTWTRANERNQSCRALVAHGWAVVAGDGGWRMVTRHAEGWAMQLVPTEFDYSLFGKEDAQRLAKAFAEQGEVNVRIVHVNDLPAMRLKSLRETQALIDTV